MYAAPATRFLEPTLDGGVYPVQQNVLQGLCELLVRMASGREVLVFVRDLSRPDTPAAGWELAMGSFVPSQFSDEIIVCGDDPRVVEVERGDSVYYDTIPAGGSWTYSVRRSHSITFASKTETITYVFVSVPTELSPNGSNPA